MTTISRYLEAEVLDPALPRDSFIPPEEDGTFSDEYVDTLVDDFGNDLGDDDVE